VSQTWELTSCRRRGEGLGSGRSWIGRINYMGWQGLMDRLKWWSQEYGVCLFPVLEQDKLE
jgi:hypothetical protein